MENSLKKGKKEKIICGSIFRNAFYGTEGYSSSIEAKVNRFIKNYPDAVVEWQSPPSSVFITAIITYT